MCFPSASVKYTRAGNKYQYNKKLIKKKWLEYFGKNTWHLDPEAALSVWIKAQNI